MATQTITRRQAWILAARPKTLPAALSPVIVGTAFAFTDGSFAWLPALAAALGALLLQILSNFANDYSDFFRGADTPDRLGPVRVTSAGLIHPEEMRRGIIVVIGLSALVGLYLIGVGGWPILAIGVAAILAALAYTGGPFPFGYYGLGELFVFLFFGVAAVCGTYYVQTLTLTPPVVIASFAVGALVTAILVVNNYRDVETDRRAGKRTLAVRLGRRGTQIEYVALLAFAYAMAFVLWLFLNAGTWVLLTLLTLPSAARLIHTVKVSTDGPTLNHALAGTAQLALLFSLLLAAGVIIG
ncbi:MAG: 1,4-dihydroxy-2-naphthoate polyprenyltransferase [Caldilinea sp.]|nr:1,4-dihydroxy-2-naphthoate polyprenyltransferase [Caldilinea sp.]MDW8442590.1 1,4-dihydroxy-2-naphthoate polyprenyltransferase [Caldilineaceae bacterium]